MVLAFCNTTCIPFRPQLCSRRLKFGATGNFKLALDQPNFSQIWLVSISNKEHGCLAAQRLPETVKSALQFSDYFFFNDLARYCFAEFYLG